MTLLARFALVAGVALAGCATPHLDLQSEGARPTMPPNNAQVVRRLYEELVNGRRFDSFGDVLASDFESSDGVRGPDGFAANVRSLTESFPDIHFTVEDVFADEDRVAVRWSWTATHGGPFRGTAPTHRRVENTGIVIYQVRDGKLVRAWTQVDRLGVLQQIGAVPVPGPR
ncbi:MAG: ester cyclase [Myxococcaceae bacterium]